MKQSKTLLLGFLGHLRRTMLAGLLLMVPLVITYLVLKFLFEAINGVLQPAVNTALGWELPGLGVAALALLVYLFGLLAANVVGRRLLQSGQSMLLRVPILNAVYSVSKQLIESFTGKGITGFRRVVLIEYPRKDTWTIGFLVSLATDERGKALGVVYIPTAPTPYSGFVAIMPLEEIYDLDLSVPEAMRLILSGGIVSPARFVKTPALTPGERQG